MRDRLLMAILGCSVMAGPAVAVGFDYDLVPGSDRRALTGYAGLNWEMGNGPVPKLVIGVFSTRARYDRALDGARLSAQFDLRNGPSAPQVKLDYLNGRTDFQGTLGVGWDFAKARPQLGVGVNGMYFQGGVDIFLDGAYVPFFGIHSQGRFDANGRSCSRVGLGEGHYFDASCSDNLR